MTCIAEKRMSVETASGLARIVHGTVVRAVAGIASRMDPHVAMLKSMMLTVVRTSVKRNPSVSCPVKIATKTHVRELAKETSRSSSQTRSWPFEGSFRTIPSRIVSSTCYLKTPDHPRMMNPTIALH